MALDGEQERQKDLKLRREKREPHCSWWVPSQPRRGIISVLIIISKGKERGCVSWLFPFNNFFLSGDSSTMKERLARGLTQAAQALR